MKRIFNRFFKKGIYLSMVKGYLAFSLVTLLVIAIVVVFTFISLNNSINNGRYPLLSAQQIVKPDFRTLKAEDITDFGGWVEIIDDNGNVVYTVGKATETKKSYTDKELVELMGWMDYSYSQLSPIGYRFDDYNSKYPQSRYYCSSVYFKANDGKEYLCLVKIPSSRLGLQLTFKNPTFKSVSFIFESLFTSIAIFIVLYTLSILLLGKWMSGKVKKPLDAISHGIERIIGGDYSVRLDISGESEFTRIGETLNYMAEKIEKGIAERAQIEKAKQEMLINISHDIKTPITTIQGYSKALLDGMVGDEGKKRQYLDCIYSKSEKVVELVDIIGSYARLESNEFKLDKQVQDLTETIREAVTICYDEIENKAFNLELQLPDMEVIYSHDKKQIERVLYNLILNAVKYNPEGTCLRIALFRYPANIRIEVADNGIGIPEELGENIFKPFIRGDKARKSDGGTGLGLSIAKKIVEEHGGQLKLIRNRGPEKTIFEISLPIN